ILILISARLSRFGFDLATNQRVYEQTMRDAAEDISVVAVRYAVDTSRLVVEFDANRGPGPHAQHTLTLRVRDSDISVTEENVPHDWLSTGTGFIDTRLSRLTRTLLMELNNKALTVGRLL
ncbi:MAG TPA: hypothetical protein VGC95_10210, partial [Chitinophagaceae bacterium]